MPPLLRSAARRCASLCFAALAELRCARPAALAIADDIRNQNRRELLSLRCAQELKSSTQESVKITLYQAVAAFLYPEGPAEADFSLPLGKRRRSSGLEARLPKAGCPPFATVRWGSDEYVLWADLCRSRAMLEGRCPAQSCEDEFTCSLTETLEPASSTPARVSEPLRASTRGEWAAALMGRQHRRQRAVSPTASTF